MSASGGRVGYGLYFIDVLGCLLFCICLALAGARFGRERSVVVDLPTAADAARTGAAIQGPAVTLRETDGVPEIRFEDRVVSLAQLADRLAEAPPPSLVLRAEASPLAELIATAHAAGVADIQLAYETRRREEATP